jgi:nucleotide-binding universal stress UspA family protein
MASSRNGRAQPAGAISRQGEPPPELPQQPEPVADSLEGRPPDGEVVPSFPVDPGAAAEGPQAWEPSLQEWRMLVPVIRAQSAGPLLQVADALSASTKSTGLVLGLVEVPRTNLPDLSSTVEEERRDLLRWIASLDPSGRETRLTIGIRVSYHVPHGIREAVYENDINLIVVEWPGLTSRRPRLLGSVLTDLVTDPPADLVLVRPDPHPETPAATRPGILVPVRGGPNSALAVHVAAALAQAQGTKLTVLNVLEKSDHPRRRAAQADRFWRLVADVRHDALEIEFVQRTSDTAAEAILAAAQDFRTVVLGASAQEPRSPTLVRAELARTVRLLRHTVILARGRRAPERRWRAYR